MMHQDLTDKEYTRVTSVVYDLAQYLAGWTQGEDALQAIVGQYRKNYEIIERARIKPESIMMSRYVYKNRSFSKNLSMFYGCIDYDEEKKKIATTPEKFEQGLRLFAEKKQRDNQNKQLLVPGHRDGAPEELNIRLPELEEEIKRSVRSNWSHEFYKNNKALCLEQVEKGHKFRKVLESLLKKPMDISEDREIFDASEKLAAAVAFEQAGAPESLKNGFANWVRDRGIKEAPQLISSQDALMQLKTLLIKKGVGAFSLEEIDRKLALQPPNQGADINARG